MPTDFSADWNGFNLMNADGDETFPICTFSYMYIHKKIQDSESARLLQAFATFVLSDDGQGMLSEFGFVKLSTATLAKSRAALAAVTYTGTAVAPWQFETATGKGNAAGTWPTTASALTTPNGMKTFSVKRGAWGDYARGVLESDLDKLVARVAVLEGHHDEPVKWYEDPKKQIDGALALGSRLHPRLHRHRPRRRRAHQDQEDVRRQVLEQHRVKGSSCMNTVRQPARVAEPANPVRSPQPSIIFNNSLHVKADHSTRLTTR